MFLKSHFFVVACGLVLLASSSQAKQSATGEQTGTAAYYSHAFEGRHTSDHGTFHSNRMTAASATLPLGTKVRLTNVRNNRSVVVRITDRYADKNRMIDVSKAAAQKLGFIHAGTAQVKMEVL